MSFTELLEKVEQLSAPERDELRQRLALLELARDPAHQEEVERRFAAMKTGQFHTAEQLRQQLTEHRQQPAQM